MFKTTEDASMTSRIKENLIVSFYQKIETFLQMRKMNTVSKQRKAENKRKF